MDPNIEGSMEKFGREFRSLLNSAKESKIISECVAVDKVRKSRRDNYETSISSPQNPDKRARSRTSSNNSNSSDLSAKKQDAIRSMRSQNVEFVMKQKKFMKAFTGRASPDLSEDEVFKGSKKEGPRSVSKSRRSSQHDKSVSEPVSPKPPMTTEEEDSMDPRDPFCWNCHKDRTQQLCSICPRSYHSKCLPVKTANVSSVANWACPECVSSMNADNVENRSPAMRRMTLSRLTTLLKFAINRMESIVGCEPFINEVNAEEFPHYRKFIKNPMTLRMLRENIEARKYGSTSAFLADARWILHNSVIFNTAQAKLTTVAKTIMKVCRNDMNEIEACPDCYHGANMRLDWFVQVCPRPHILVWAKLKGFPYWPAKVLAIANTGLIDVRFFGAHDKAWLKPQDCYLYSTEDPNNTKQRKTEIITALVELKAHTDKLSVKWGPFKPAPFKTPYNPQECDDVKVLKMMLPNYVPSEDDVSPYIVACSPDNKSQNNSPDSKSSPLSVTLSPHQDNMQPKVILTAFSEKLKRNIFTEKYDTEDEESILEETGNIVRTVWTKKKEESLSSEPKLDVKRVVSTYERSHKSIAKPTTVNNNKTMESEKINSINVPAKRSRSKSMYAVIPETILFNDDSLTAKSPSKSGSFDSNDPDKLVLEYLISDNEQQPEMIGKRKRTLSDAGSPCKKTKNDKDDDIKEKVTKADVPIQTKMRSRGKSVDSKIMMCYREAVAKKKQSESVDKCSFNVKESVLSDDNLVIDESHDNSLDSNEIDVTRIDETENNEATVSKEKFADGEKDMSGDDKSISVARNTSTPVTDKRCSPIRIVRQSSFSESKEKTGIINESTTSAPNGLENVSIENVVSIKNKPLTSVFKILSKKKSKGIEKKKDLGKSKRNKDTLSVRIPIKVTAALEKKSSKDTNILNTLLTVSKSPDKSKSPVLTTSEVLPISPQSKKQDETRVLSTDMSDSEAILKTKALSNVAVSLTDLEQDIRNERSYDALESISDAVEPPSPQHNTKSSNKNTLSTSNIAAEKSERTTPDKNVKAKILRRQSVGSKADCNLHLDLKESSPRKEEQTDFEELIESTKTNTQDKESFAHSLCLRPSDSPTNSVPKISQLMTRNMTNCIINGQTNTVHSTTIKKITNNNKNVVNNESPEKNIDPVEPLRGKTVIKRISNFNKATETITKSAVANNQTSPDKDATTVKTNESVMLWKQLPNVTINNTSENTNNNKKKPTSPNITTIKKHKNIESTNFNRPIAINSNNKPPSSNIGVKVVPLAGKNLFRIMSNDSTNLKNTDSSNSNKINVKNVENEQVNSVSNIVKNISRLTASNSMVYIPTDTVFSQPSPAMSTNTSSNSNQTKSANENNQQLSDVTSSSNVQMVVNPPPLILNNGNGGVLLRPLQSLIGEPQQSQMDTSSQATTNITTGTLRVVPQAFLLNNSFISAAAVPPTTSATVISTSSVDNNTLVDIAGQLPKVIPPNQAGNVSKALNDSAYKMYEYFRHLIEESVSSIGNNTGSLEAQVFTLKAQVERLKWYHQVKFKELKHNTETQIKEIRACLEAEKQRAIQEVKRVAESEKINAINETKRKQWCIQCYREADLYCCRGALYCDYACQQAHWPTHMEHCMQTPSEETQITLQNNLRPANLTPVNLGGNRKRLILKQVSSSSVPSVIKNVSLLSSAASQSIPSGYKLISTQSSVANNCNNVSSNSHVQTTTGTNIILSQQVNASYVNDISNTDNNTNTLQRIAIPMSQSSDTIS